MELSWPLIIAGSSLLAAGVGGLLTYLLLKPGQHKNQQERLERQMQEQLQQIEALEHRLLSAREQVLVLETRETAQQEQLQKSEQQSQQLRETIDSQQRQLAGQGADMAALRTELEQQQLLAADKIKTLEETRQQLTKDFELLANRIFEEKTQSFNQHSKSTLDTALNPLREQLKDFKQKVEDVYDKDSKERVSLSAQLDHLKQLNQQMSADALNLTNALKGDNKAQGNWGEVILERVLEESGLRKGREYDTQVSLSSAQGRSQPDVVVRLPENKDLIIDSKVSLVHYERYCNNVDEADRQQALKDHISSVRKHIKDLSIKNYEGLEGIRTLDFVLIFIPIESAFMAAFEHDQAMFREAYEKNIIVVGPTTLLATLRTIQSIWRYERQNKNAEEIARQAGAMHDKFIGFISDLDKVSDHLVKAGQAHDAAMNKLSTGKGNLVGSTLRLEKLGAKVKKQMPGAMIESLSADDEAEEIDDKPLLSMEEGE